MATGSRASERNASIPLTCLGGAFAVALVLAAEPLFAQQPSLGVSSGLTAVAFRYQVGRRITYLCPATSPPSNTAVWGTKDYTFSSAVCIAAIHAGVLAPQQAGPVTFVMGLGAASFSGSSNHGVTSANYTGYDSSFSFDSSEPGRVDGLTTMHAPAGFLGSVAVVCPPLGTFPQPLWGTDIYADDSSICAAAAHAGLITLDAGGPVTVTEAGPQPSFAASKRNGVTSEVYGAWPTSFRVAAAGAQIAVLTAAPTTGTITPIAPAATAPAPTPTPSTSTPSAPVGAGLAPATAPLPVGTPATLRLDGADADVRFVQGGSAVLDVAEIQVGGVITKRLAGPRFEPIVLETVPGSVAIDAWIKAALTRGGTRRSGALIGGVVAVGQQLEFSDALVTGFALPSLDAGSSAPGYFRVTLTPEQTRQTTSVTSAASVARRKVAWMSSNFRLSMPGLETNKIVRIESLSVTMTPTADQVGLQRQATRESGIPAISNVLVTFLSDARSPTPQWLAWYDSFVLKGNMGDDQEKTFTLDLLTPTLRTPVVTLQGSGVGIVSLRALPYVPGTTLPMLQAELYVESLDIVIP